MNIAQTGFGDSLAPVHTDEALVARLRAGETSAFELLMRRHNQRLYRLARSILRDPDDAQDAVQEAYVRAYFKLDSYVESGSFGAWLSRITMNEALMIRRRRRQPNDDAMNIDLLVAPERGPGELHANRELAGLIESAVDRLPVEFRTVFMLRAIQQLSVEETSVSLDIPGATVKTRLHRARKLMRRMLEAHIDEAGLEAFEFAGRRCDRIVARVMQRITNR